MPICLDATATFTAPLMKPPAAPQAGQCNATKIAALSTACADDPTLAGCTTARTADPTCASCVFSTAADTTWKSVVYKPGETPPVTYNQAGCIDHVTAVPGCGAKYVTILRCANTFCGELCQTQQEYSDCLDHVKVNQCAGYLLGANDTACSNALQTKQIQVEDTCFAAGNTVTDIQNFFTAMATLQCPN
jgi:hypothetical protein